MNLVVHGHGRVSPAAHSYAHRKISGLDKFAGGPVLFAKVDLIAHPDPARGRGALAKAEFDVNGRMVRAHAEARTMHAAIDELESRLGGRLKEDRRNGHRNHDGPA